MQIEKLTHDANLNLIKVASYLDKDIDLIMLAARDMEILFFHFDSGFVDCIEERENGARWIDSSKYTITDVQNAVPPEIIDHLVNSESKTFKADSISFYNVGNDDEIIFYNCWTDIGYGESTYEFKITPRNIFLKTKHLSLLKNRLNLLSTQSNGEVMQNRKIPQKTKDSLLKTIGALILCSKTINKDNKFLRNNGKTKYNISEVANYIQDGLSDNGYNLDGVKDRKLREILTEAVSVIEENRQV